MKYILFLFLNVAIFAQVDSTFNARTQQTFVKLLELEVMVGELKERADSIKHLADSLQNIIDNGIRIIWYGWEQDSTQFVNGEPRRNPDGSFPKREDGSYVHLKQDSTGKLIERRTLKFYSEWNK